MALTNYLQGDPYEQRNARRSKPSSRKEAEYFDLEDQSPHLFTYIDRTTVILAIISIASFTIGYLL